MDQQEYRLQIAEVAGTWLAALAVVIGGLFGVFQYLEHKSAVRIDRTMAFVERYHSDGLLLEARLKISNSMKRRVGEINELLTDPAIKPKNLAQKYNSEINRLIETDELYGSLEQILTFYEQIIMCRELNLCDVAIAEQFFDTDGKAFIRTYYPYVCQLREQWNNPEKYELVLAFYVGNSKTLCDS